MNFEMFDPNSNQKARISGQRFTGVMMIGTGLIFMIAMSGVRIFGYSPWILMALLPVLWSLGTAVKHLLEDGRVTPRVLIPLFFALVPFGFVALSMMGLNLGQYWPVLAIAIGVYFIFKR